MSWANSAYSKIILHEDGGVSAGADTPPSLPIRKVHDNSLHMCELNSI